MSAREPLSLRQVTRFTTARTILAALIGYASPRAATDDKWADRLEDWTHRLRVLTPRDVDGVAHVHTADADSLRKLLRS